MSVDMLEPSRQRQNNCLFQLDEGNCWVAVHISDIFF